MSVNCYKCNKELDLALGKDVGRSEECPGCFASLRVCKMCEFYDTSSYNECREPTAERIVDKEKANFCDHFKVGVASKASEKKDSALAAANALFKK